MAQSFYNLRNGGLADKALLVMVHRITNHGGQAGANAKALPAVRLCRLDEEHDRTIKHTFSLQKEITATRAEVTEFREQQATMERHIIEAERQVARAKTSTTTYHGLQRPTRSE
ncbi:unnamed protein product [Lactuca saligna]|uniref:Uncharacterized protein n=1 Tax=Lactuca saligna TaxID=75948 RepID=A0AA35YA50_LACSI|nr:unnamed protein product [Lactuca saligna]